MVHKEKNKNYIPFIFYSICLVLVIVLCIYFLGRDTFAIFSKREVDESKEMKIHMLNVGQGDATFIEFPDGMQILIDVGRDRSVVESLSEVMRFNNRFIDMVILTHPDADHVGGLSDLVAFYDIGMIIDRVDDSQDFDSRDVYEKAIGESGAVHIELHDNAIEMNLGDGSQMYFFPNIINAYDYDDLIDDRNEYSVMGKITYRDTSFLWVGDMSHIGERLLVELYRDDPSMLDTDILQIGHHGSKTSSSELFLRATTPKLGLISAGADNNYGHPYKGVLERLYRLGIPHVCTCTDGAVTLASDGEDWWIE